MDVSYYGTVQTVLDALLIFEACRLGVLNKINRRLSEKERQLVRSGAVFVWDEEQTGVRRWTDGRAWTASRINGNFLIYRELDGKRKPPINATSTANNPTYTSSPDMGRSALSSSPLASGFISVSDTAFQSASCSPSSSPAVAGAFKNVANLKTDGLIKLSFSVTRATGNRFHLVHYYTPADLTSGLLKKPSEDPALAGITISREYYPDSVDNLRAGDLKLYHRCSSSPNLREKSKKLQVPRSVLATVCDMKLQQQQKAQLVNRPPLQIHDSKSEFSDPFSLHVLSTNGMNAANFHRGSVSSNASSNDSDTSFYALPATPPAYFTSFSIQPAPYQEVAWEKFPNSEVKRQLEAVYATLSL